MTGAAPFHRDVAGGPEGVRAAWIAAEDGVRLRAVHWPLEGARGTVLLFSGRTEYAEKYGLAAAEFAARGYATATLDWRGQGLSDRLQEDAVTGHVVRFRDYQRDVAALLGHVRGLGLPRPLYLVAHSLGGAIGLRALHEGLGVEAAVFSAPMWGILFSAPVRAWAWGLTGASRALGFSTRMAPGKTPHPYVLKEAFEANTLTHDRAMWERMGRQIDAHPDLALGLPSLNWLYEALAETRALHRADSPAVPAVTFLGTEEQIVDEARIHARMARWPDGRLEVVEGARHEIMMELPEMRTRFFDTARDLFEAHRGR